MNAASRPRRGPVWSRGLVSALGILVALGCSEASEPVDPGAPQTLSTDVAQRLLALGYIDWDEDADASVSGAIWHAKERAAPGLNLFTNDSDTVWLMDGDGVFLREWVLPGRQHCEHVELISGPRLAVVCEGDPQALVILDPDGTVLMEIEASVHHDVAERANGALLVPVREEAGFYRGRKVMFDALLEVATDGSTRQVWSSRAAIDSLRALHGPTELDAWPSPLDFARVAYRRLFKGKKIPTHEYYHLNSVEVLGPNALEESDERFRAGNILLGLRNANSAAILDSATWEPVWHWGEDILDLPHMPTLLDSGHLLVFDNGTERGWTRIIEVDPRTGRVIWQHPESPDPSFLSAWRGSSQRLPNGNTLVCLSEEGRVIELDASGEIVWEFWNPELGEKGRKRIYRFIRIPPDEAAVLLEASQSRAPSS